MSSASAPRESVVQRLRAQGGTADSYAIELWLSEAEIAALEYAGYWNDEEQEREKEWYILDGDFAKMERHLRAVGLIAQLDACAACLEHDLGWRFHGTGVDLACGNLWAVPSLLAQPGVERLYCVEYSHHRLLKIGPAVLAHYGVPPEKVVLCLGSFYRLALPSGALDFAFLSAAFHHAERPGELLAEIRRVLAPGGVLVVIGEHAFSPLARARHLARFWLSRPLPPRLRERFLGTILVPRGRALCDPELGDQFYLDQEYDRLFAAAGFRCRRLRVGGRGAQAFVLTPG